jgi:hypothetical protein
MRADWFWSSDPRERSSNPYAVKGMIAVGLPDPAPKEPKAPSKRGRSASGWQDLPAKRALGYCKWSMTF